MAENGEKPEKEHESGLDKSTIRDFSREFSKEDRSKTAEEIWSKRKEHFGQRRETREDIELLTQEGIDKRKTAEEIAREIEGLETSIESKKQNKILELFSYFKIRKMEEDLGIKREVNEQIERDYATLSRALSDLNEKVLDKTKLTETKETLSKFYAGQEEKWNSYQEELKERDVKNIANKYDITFVHGIHPNFIPSDNSMLEDWVDWKTKLKILTTFEPTISTSTIKKGDDWKRMWSRMGVVLSGGSVESASFGDQGSRALGIKERNLYSGYQGVSQIEKAITHEKNHGNTWPVDYNELVVRSPEISGLYICLDSTFTTKKVGEDTYVESGIIKNDLVPPEEMAETAKEMGLKLYAIKGGVVYEAEYDENSKRIIPKRETNKDGVLSEKYEMGDERKNAALEGIFEDSPFKIKSPELSYINSSGYGRQSYISLTGEKNKNLPGIESEFQNGAYGLQINPDGKIKVIEEIPIVGQKLKIFEADGRLCMERINTHGNGRNVMGIERGDMNFPDRYINLGWGTHDLKRDINSIGDYLDAMEESLEELKEKTPEKEKESYQGQRKFYEEWKTKLAFHLYGFAEEARKFGNVANQERSEKIAGQVIGKEYYKDVLNRRIDKDGRLRITEEDLK